MAEMPPPTLAVHGHFYQPPRENPWTEVVAAEPSAAPRHDWNERITEESYRPNGWARIVDERGRVVALVNNYAHLSFNVGPTLLSWLDEHAPDVLARMVDGDRQGGGGVAQAYNHMILPLANERDVRTQVRWGLADFRHRFGRDADGIWLPETAVDDAVLRVLAEEGLRFTILAPTQAARVRPLPTGLLGHEEPWTDVGDGGVDTRRGYRWCDPHDPDVQVDLVFYDGALSHDLAFGLGSLTAEALAARAREVAGDGGLVCIATDGETFGHHHTYAERTLAYALPVAAARAGLDVSTVGAWLRDHPPMWQADVKRSAWSCAHGVGRWSTDCGCSTGGALGADQRWREPLRHALDLLRDAGAEVFERRGGKVLHDPWAARDAYVDVLLGARPVDDFAHEHVCGDLVEALTLLEQQRHALLMYTSCAWFFWDLAGLETVQCLRYAARAMDLLAEVGEVPPVDAFLEVLGRAESNQPGEGNGRDVWHRHVEPARVTPERVAAHLAMADVLEGERPTGPVAIWDVVEADHRRIERGPITACTGVLTLLHRRTQRVTRHAYAAAHLGGLEVSAAVRPAQPERDADDVRSVIEAVDRGERITGVLRLVADRFGPAEFGLESTMPDAAEQIVASAAQSVADRFGAAFIRLSEDHRAVFGSLVAAGYPLPQELRVPAELALDRRLEAEIEAQHGSWDPEAYRAAVAIAGEAAEHGLTVTAPRARAALQRTFEDAVSRVVDGDADAVEAALALLHLGWTIGVGINVDRAQEAVYEEILAGRGGTGLMLLGAELDLAVERLGVPDA
jgi:alpha-amylase/alpha-mannosidase (GH57 family)